MSQYKFKAGEYEVLVGYDEPLNYFFMVVDSPNNKEDQPIWSNLSNTKNSFAQDFEEYKEVAKKLGFEIPEDIIENCFLDRNKKL